MWRKALPVCKRVKTFAVLLGAAVVSVSAFAQRGGAVVSPGMPSQASPMIGAPWFSPGRENPEAMREPSRGNSKASAPTKTEFSAESGETGADEPISDSPAMNQTSSEERMDQIFHEMEEIKSWSSDSAEMVKNSISASAVLSTESAAKNQSSHLIRFTVNGQDVLHTCRKVYISDVQDDGTFLVTGNRRYNGDGGMYTESFNLLFKKDATSTGLQNYHAAAAVNQGTENSDSPLYQLSQRGNMTATRVGNMVSVRENDEDFNLELLIDLGEE